jgi:hypothetical protein
MIKASASNLADMLLHCEFVIDINFYERRLWQLVACLFRRAFIVFNQFLRSVQYTI